MFQFCDTTQAVLLSCVVVVVTIINFVCAWFEYSVNMSWFILDVVGVDADQNRIVYKYYSLRALSQLLSLFTSFISVCNAVFYKGSWKIALSVISCIWFLGTAYMDVYFRFELWKALTAMNILNFVIVFAMFMWYLFGLDLCDNLDKCHKMFPAIKIFIEIAYVCAIVVLIIQLL